MIFTSDCTVYIANETGFDRLYIPKCCFLDAVGGTADNTGLKNNSSAVIYIPKEYASFSPIHVSKDMIVKGECLFEFDNTSPAAVSQSMKEFRKQYAFYTVMSIENRLHGSMQTGHIKVTAK